MLKLQKNVQFFGFYSSLEKHSYLEKQKNEHYNKEKTTITHSGGSRIFWLRVAGPKLNILKGRKFMTAKRHIGTVEN